MTLEGAKKYLRSNRDEADYRLEIADTLRNIRAMLMDIRDEIK
jgi:hypothetical protein